MNDENRTLTNVILRTVFAGIVPKMTEHCFNVRDVGFDPGNIHPMLVHCELIFSDTGPTLYQRWVNVSCLLGCVKKCYVERAVPPLLGGTVSKAVAQH